MTNQNSATRPTSWLWVSSDVAAGENHSSVDSRATRRREATTSSRAQAVVRQIMILDHAGIHAQPGAGSV